MISLEKLQEWCELHPNNSHYAQVLALTVIAQELKRIADLLEYRTEKADNENLWRVT